MLVYITGKKNTNQIANSFKKRAIKLWVWLQYEQPTAVDLPAGGRLWRAPAVTRAPIVAHLGELHVVKEKNASTPPDSATKSFCSLDRFFQEGNVPEIHMIIHDHVIQHRGIYNTRAGEQKRTREVFRGSLSQRWHPKILEAAPTEAMNRCTISQSRTTSECSCIGGAASEFRELSTARRASQGLHTWGESRFCGQHSVKNTHFILL